ncbi:MAG: hypothetical protein Q7R43_04555 [Candidatus Daviesbacteria bacterium]|nr:hypothetical protein [Candidatus Daviesbacteria bacterium]
MIPERVKRFILPSYVSPEALRFEQEFLSSQNKDIADLYRVMRGELDGIASKRNGVCYPIIAEIGEDKILDYAVREQYYYPLRESLSTIRKMKPKSLPRSLWRDFLLTAKFPLQTTRQTKYHIEVLRAWMTSSKKENEAEICWNVAAKKNKFNRERLKENFQNAFEGNPFKISVAIWDYDHFRDRWNFDLPKNIKWFIVS